MISELTLWLESKHNNKPKTEVQDLRVPHQANPSNLHLINKHPRGCPHLRTTEWLNRSKIWVDHHRARQDPKVHHLAWPNLRDRACHLVECLQVDSLQLAAVPHKVESHQVECHQADGPQHKDNPLNQRAHCLVTTH